MSERDQQIASTGDASSACCGSTERAADRPVAMSQASDASDCGCVGEGLPVAVIGGGPVGLAAAAHLAERGIDFVVIEAGDRVGASIAEWGHVRLFSPWRYDTDAVARRLLEPTGWTAPDLDHLPTGAELLTGYLEPLAALPQIATRLWLNTRVEAISRQGYDRLRTTAVTTPPTCCGCAPVTGRPKRCGLAR